MANAITQTKITKQQLINNINKLTSEYLGHTTEVYGTKSMSKDRLLTMETQYQLMVELKNQAQAIKSQYDETQWRLASLFPESCDRQVVEDGDRYEDLSKQASKIWFTKF